MELQKGRCGRFEPVVFAPLVALLIASIVQWILCKNSTKSELQEVMDFLKNLDKYTALGAKLCRDVIERGKDAPPPMTVVDVCSWPPRQFLLPIITKMQMSVSIDGTNSNMFVSGSCDATARLWDTRIASRAVRTFHGHEGDVCTVA
ncbi:hypothetical protein Syun_029590 [Stephania yunnanensis]|uniref:Uncharacterized protein n=1 Tax=Stephania yunnanensis TaxID=152371 RepID=A0AAP0HK01_9MAGN